MVYSITKYVIFIDLKRIMGYRNLTVDNQSRFNRLLCALQHTYIKFLSFLMAQIKIVSFLGNLHIYRRFLIC